MDLVHGLVEQASASAMSLQTTVEETSEKIKRMGLLNGLGAFVSTWGWLFIIITGLGLINRFAAGFLAIGAGEHTHPFWSLQI